MCNLMLADDLFPAVMMRQQRNTIRFRHRDVPLGPTMFVPTKDETRLPLVIDVTNVRHCAFRELTLDDLHNQGRDASKATLADDLTSYLAEMQRFYPEMTMDSPVTVIHFDYLREQHEFS